MKSLKKGGGVAMFLHKSLRHRASVLDRGGRGVKKVKISMTLFMSTPLDVKKKEAIFKFTPSNLLFSLSSNVNQNATATSKKAEVIAQLCNKSTAKLFTYRPMNCCI